MVKTIREEKLFSPGHHLLVAISGGPDSVALLSLLAELAPSWGLRLTAVHFNYQLRGRESEEDEAFVVAFCRERNIPLLIRRPVLVKAKRQTSLQALARDARYAAMKSIAFEVGADRIVVGHTANDQAETVLMWMLRGAGLTGLAGMPFMRDALIVRPLLSVGHEEILKYLQQERLQYRKDSSNESARFRRNRIRRELVPVMEQIAPATVRLLQRQAILLRDDERYLDQVAREIYASLVRPDVSGGQRFDRKTFAVIPAAIQRRIVRMVLRQADPKERAPQARVVEEVLRFILNPSNRTCLALKHAAFLRDGDAIVVNFQERTLPASSVAAESSRLLDVPVPVPSTVYWVGTRQEIHVQVIMREVAERLVKQATPECAVFDADRFSGPLLIRGWRAGDRFYPAGMGGKSKKLQDFFMDAKVGRQERRRIPLLVAHEGILWIIGYRQDERFRVREGSTRCLVAAVNSKPVRGGAG